MSRSSPPPSPTAGRAASDESRETPDRPANHPTLRRKLNLRLAALMRWTHIYLSMFGLAALLFFTGGLQNPFSFLFLAPVLISATALPARFTFGLGLLYKHGPWTASIIDKYVGEQWANEGQPSNFRIPGYHQADVSVSYAIDRFKIEAQVQNITNSQAVTAITPLGKANVVSPYDQYFWQAPANFQLSLKVAF